MNNNPWKEHYTDKILDEIRYLVLEEVVPITGIPSNPYELAGVRALQNFGWKMIQHLIQKGLIKIV
jgi:hypothetical protein